MRRKKSNANKQVVEYFAVMAALSLTSNAFFTMNMMISRDITTHHQEQESGRTTIRSNPSDACFQHFLFICLHRRIPLGVTSHDLNWLAREQGFASYPSGSASGLDLFYIRLPVPVDPAAWRMAAPYSPTTRIRAVPTPPHPCHSDADTHFTLKPATRFADSCYCVRNN